MWISGVIDAGAETNRIAQHLSDSVQAAPERVLVFFDLASFSRYHSDVRIQYTEALRKHGRKVETIWVYAESKLVRMGATVASMVLRQLHLVDREVFDAELRKAVRS
jgi:hypothetical protein